MATGWFLSIKISIEKLSLENSSVLKSYCFCFPSWKPDCPSTPEKGCNNETSRYFLNTTVFIFYIKVSVNRIPPEEDYSTLRIGSFSHIEICFLAKIRSLQKVLIVVKTCLVIQTHRSQKLQL